jgi:hypothetical protein
MDETKYIFQFGGLHPQGKPCLSEYRQAAPSGCGFTPPL